MNIHNIKKTAVALMVSTALSVSSVSPVMATGIPVFDAASVAQAIQQGIQMAQQIKNQVKQLNELKSQVKAFTGSRGLGEFAKDAALDQVPDEWKGIYRDMKDKSYKNLTDKSAYKSDGGLEALAAAYENAYKAIKNTEKRVENLNTLMQQINQTQDAKAAADLQNRIAIEQAQIHNSQIALDLADRLVKQEEKIRAAQQRNIVSCQIQASSKAARKDCGSI